MNYPIILLHGLGANTLTMKPLEWFLKIKYKNHRIHNIGYRNNDIHYDEALSLLDKKLEEYISKENDNPIVIGQSMGGVMANNLHKKGWKVLKSITIGSPLHGARFLHQLKNKLPTFITNKLYKKSYQYLMEKDKDDEPPHDYHTITMSLPFSNEFDGCVYKDEGILDPNKNTHINWTDHRLVFGSPRLLHHVHQQIKLVVK